MADDMDSKVEYVDTERPCPKCKQGTIKRREFENGARAEICHKCGHREVIPPKYV